MARSFSKKTVIKKSPLKKSAAVKAKDGIPEQTATAFNKMMEAHRSDAELKKHHRFFKFDESKPVKGMQFMGVRMGQIFSIAQEFLDMPPDEIRKLLKSPVYEIRTGACSIMGKQGAYKKTTDDRRKELYDLYLNNHQFIDHWGHVDLAAHKVIGSYLYDFNKPRAILYKLARSKDQWERRSAIISTLYFIGKGDVDDAFKLADLLVNDKEEFVQTATGWALRYAGDKDEKQLLRFLDKHAATMPRVTLRFALEHLDKKKREHYMSLKKIKDKN